jgi:hypothetical protein
MLRRTLKSQAGMGLAEVMVASALLGGLSLVVMKLNEQGTQGVARVEKGIEAADFDREVVSFIALKTACNQTVGTPTLTSITGQPGLNLTQIKNESGTVVLTVGDKRGVVELVSMRIHSYTPATRMASFTKVFRFQLSPGKFATKTKTSKISIVPNAANTNLSTCIATTSVTDDVWTVDDYGIFYDDKQVVIGQDAGEETRMKLRVHGSMGAGQGHFLADGGEYDNMVILGGKSHTLWDFFPAATNPLKNSAIVAGFENKLYDQRSDVSAMNNVILGGETNLIDSTNHSVIGGGGLNFVSKTSGIGSAVIGGQLNWINGDKSASPAYATWSVKTRPYGSNVIAGGVENLINQAEDSFIAGGYKNLALYNQYMAIIGGVLNTVSSQNSAIIGGIENTVVSGIDSAGIFASAGGQVASDYSAIVGGTTNKVDVASDASVIIGGSSNSVNTSSLSAIVAGNLNTLNPNSTNSLILGGFRNKVTGGEDTGIILGKDNSVNAEASVVIGGKNNIINKSTSDGRSLIAGGMSNSINQAAYATIVGGESNIVNETHSIILGGSGNRVNKQSPTQPSDRSAIIGGNQNTVSRAKSAVLVGELNTVESDFSAIIAGDRNKMNFKTWTSVILGGNNNTIEGGVAPKLAEDSAQRSIIAGGYSNRIIDKHSAIIGGYQNTIQASNSGIFAGFSNLVSGSNSIILGGSSNTVTASNSMAFGKDISLTHAGSVILKDDEIDNFISEAEDTFSAKFKNGISLCSLTYTNPVTSTNICTGGLEIDSTGKLIARGHSGGLPYSGNIASGGPMSLVYTYNSSGMWFENWYIGSRASRLASSLFGAWSQSLAFGTSAIKMVLYETSGNLALQGDVTPGSSFSDERLKTDMRKLKNVTSKLKSLSGYSFTYKNDGKKSIGVSAQELEKVFPELVYFTNRIGDDETEYRAVRYQLLPAILIEGFKEQQVQIEKNQEMLTMMKEGIETRLNRVEEELEELREENNELRAKLEMLMKRIDKVEKKFP